MSAAPRGQGNTLGIAIVISVILVGLVVLVATRVRLPKSPDMKSPPPNTSSVAIARADPQGGSAALLAQVEIYDQKPLFLPTLINNSDPALPASLRREPSNAFKTISPQLTFAEYEMSIVLPEPITVPKTVIEALHTGETANPFFTFGRINYPYTPLPKRLAYIEVVQAKTGRVVLAAPVSAGTNESLPPVDWQPLELVVAIENSGMVGMPTVTSDSGFAEVNDYFRAFIAKQFRLGARLPPGLYLLRIGQ